nr:G protein-coupled receptor [Proales similis]
MLKMVAMLFYFAFAFTWIPCQSANQNSSRADCTDFTVLFEQILRIDCLSITDWNFQLPDIRSNNLSFPPYLTDLNLNLETYSKIPFRFEGLFSNTSNLYPTLQYLKGKLRASYFLVQGVSGFELSEQPVRINPEYINQFTFSFSKITALLNGREMKDCVIDQPLYFGFDLGKWGRLTFKGANRFSNHICGSMFYQSRIYLLQIDDVENSMISINTPAFKSPKWTNGQLVELYSQIKILSISGYNYELTLERFPPTIFGRTTQLEIIGEIGKLERQLFAAIPVIFMYLKNMHVRKFFHNNLDVFSVALDIETDIPFFVEIGSFFVRKHERLTDLEHNPTYPKSYYETAHVELNKFLVEDEDFCLFANYRHSKRKIEFPNNRFTNIEFTIKYYGCTCTLLMMTIWNLTSGCDISNQTLIQSCQFAKRFEGCEKQAIEPMHQIGAFEVVHAVQMLKLISTVAIGPIVSLLSIVLNGITLKVFRMMHDSPEYRANKQKAANDKMWEYLRHNCALNLLQSIIFLFIPLTTCVEFNGIYCSPLILDRPVQWFFLLVQTYAGNVLKLMSSVTYSAFVMYRLAFNTDRWKRFRSMKPTRVMVGTLIFSAVWSVPTIFENGRFGVEIFSKSHYSYLAPTNSGNIDYSVFLNVAFLLNKALINVLLPTLNTIFDIWLLRFIKQKTKERKKESSEKKVTKMIVIGGLFSLFFRLPEFVVTIIRILFNIDPFITPLCVLALAPEQSMCQSLFESALTFYSIGFLENFVILCVVHQEFKKSIKHLLKPAG